jgi:hypothetical protein
MHIGYMNNALFSRRQTLALGAGAFFAPSLARAAAAKQPTLIELFTSQGCSSCPPADKLAAELAKDPANLVVSFNVDYWDYLGWRDTLAKPEYSQRQYDYAKTRGDGAVYTPQMVFNGTSHAVGSKASEVQSHIEQSQHKGLAAHLSLTLDDKAISVTIEAAPVSGEATLWLMAIAPEVKQAIGRGENSGEDITYVNVVRNLVPAAMWKGEAYSGSWMRDAVMTPDCTSCIAVLQTEKTGPLLGVARA